MEHDSFVYLSALLFLYSLLQIPTVYGKVTPWCGIIDFALVDRNYTTINATKNHKLCYQACLKETPRCKSANYRPEVQECDLNCASHFDVCTGGRLVEQPGSIYTYTAFKIGCDTQSCSTNSASNSIGSVPPCGNHQGSDWQLVFKGVAGTGIKLFDLWTNAAWDSDSEDHGNYRNEALYTCWKGEQLSVKRVKLSLYDKTEVKVALVFNGTDSDILSWFAKERLVSSPWSDLTTAAATNYFSLTALDKGTHIRRFYIGRSHGGCPNDSGWMVVIDLIGSCNYEQLPSPVILYSTQSGSVTWQQASNTGTLGKADYLTIHIAI